MSRNNGALAAAEGGPGGAASALDMSPGRFRRIVRFAHGLGIAGVCETDAIDAIEEAIWANGALPADTPSQRRAWGVVRSRALEAFSATDSAIEVARHRVQNAAPAIFGRMPPEAGLLDFAAKLQDAEPLVPAEKIERIARGVVTQFARPPAASRGPHPTDVWSTIDTPPHPRRVALHERAKAMAAASGISIALPVDDDDAQRAERDAARQAAIDRVRRERAAVAWIEIDREERVAMWDAQPVQLATVDGEPVIAPPPPPMPNEAKAIIFDAVNSLREVADGDPEIGNVERFLVRAANGMESSIKSTGRGLVAAKGVTAAVLMAMQFPAIKWVVPGYITEGLTLFAGAPKIGKSWLALGLGIAVASGTKAFGEIECEAGPVLYLALEDNLRRIQSRLRHMGVRSAPDALTIMTTWPTVDEDCIAQLELWLDDNPDARMIVIDVFAKVKSGKGGNKPQYDVDYKDVTTLQRLAIDRGVAILIVHHTRKMESDDPFDAVSGTRGLTGSADSTFVLTRASGQARPALYGRGRDIEEIEREMEFDPTTGRWSIAGPVVALASSPERQAILDVLKRASRPVALADIAEATQKSKANVTNMLGKMIEAGTVRKAATGQYEIVAPAGAITRSATPWGTYESDESDES